MSEQEQCCLWVVGNNKDKNSMQFQYRGSWQAVRVINRKILHRGSFHSFVFLHSLLCNFDVIYCAREDVPPPQIAPLSVQTDFLT